MKEFQQWWHRKTDRMTAQERKAFRIFLQQKLCKSNAVLSRWINGKSEPNELEKKSINIILKARIYGN